MNLTHYMAIVLALLVIAGISRIAQAEQRPAVHVAACGLEFDLPAGYKITRPKRYEDSRRDARQCAFDIVPTRPEPPPRGECKGKDEGGQPPYGLCDWMIDAGGLPPPNVQVARTRTSGSSPLLDSFTLDDDGRWMVPNAQAGDQLAEASTYCGKPAWKGEHVVRMYWYRTRTKHFTSIYAGSSGAEVTLVQFAPDLFVQLQNPPINETGEFSVFCTSLRLGARTRDLP